MVMLILPVLAFVAAASAAILPMSVPRTGAISIIPSPESHATTPHAAGAPLLIWHGLGDSYDSEGIASVAALYKSTYPGAVVHAIAADPSNDAQATFWGHVDDQVAQACHALSLIPDFAFAPRINALGFSQGGQFLRALVQRCGTRLNVRSLVTFGSQHNGIATFAECAEDDWWCNTWSSVLRSNTWSEFVQSNLVPAQYFRDPEDLSSYLESSGFLADVNNEREAKNQTYKANLQKLDRFVMYLFEGDEVVHPKESSWFAEVNGTTGNVTHLRQRDIYKEDWLGLKSLDEKGALAFRKVPGGHMKIAEKTLKHVFETDFAPESEKKLELELESMSQAVFELKNDFEEFVEEELETSWDQVKERLDVFGRRYREDLMT